MVNKVKSKSEKGIKTPPIAHYVCPITKQVFEDVNAFQAHLKTFRQVTDSQAVVDLVFQAPIARPPMTQQGMQQTYSAADAITIKTWWDEWLKNKTNNLRSYDVLKNNVMLDYGKFAFKPVIIAGSGPSLKKNAEQLKDRGDIGLVSTLHNFGYFEEIGVKADYYLNLDAGDITIPEAAEGFTDIYKKIKGLSIANKTAYLDKCNFWDRTKDKTLVTALNSNPELIKRWQGRVLWFDTVLQGMNGEVSKECPEIKDFRVVYQTGGNTLGACLYHARAILGGSPIVFIGADFSFKDKKFHSWDSPYDAQCTGTIPCVDVYGQKQETWQSYYGFKTWFEFIAMGGHGNTIHSFVNCTEGGILGSYPEGNIIQIRQRTLREFIAEYNLHRELPKILKNKKQLMTLF